MTSSLRLAAHQAGKKATSQADMMISLNRAQRALMDINMGGAEDTQRASAILSEYIEERGGSLAPSASAQGKPSQSKASAPASSAGYSAADVGLAHGRGVAAERARVSTVFASEHSKGRSHSVNTARTGFVRECPSRLMPNKGSSEVGE